jgi:Zn finger protein HypA/HybF involved in hydrogenase expression
VEVDFSGQTPLGKCPKCKNRVFEMPMHYMCEKATGPNRTCDFRSGKIILQQPIERDQMQKLLEQGKTDLLQKFVSNKTHRAFKAFLKLNSAGKVEFEFEPRAAKSKNAKSKEPKPPAPKLDFTGQQPLGECPKCGGKVFEGPESYTCEKSQAEKRPCKFKINKVIAQLPITREQAIKLLTDHRSDLLDKFVSKAGKNFPAYLLLDDTGKVTFEFPPREAEIGFN